MWELDHKESWASKNWYFWIVVLEKTLESSLDSKEIQPVPPKGNQSWTFFGRIDVDAEAPIFWPPDAKSWPIRKDRYPEQDWRQEEKGMTEDEIVGWHELITEVACRQIFFFFSLGKVQWLFWLQSYRIWWIFPYFNNKNRKRKLRFSTWYTLI